MIAAGYVNAVKVSRMHTIGKKEMMLNPGCQIWEQGKQWQTVAELDGHTQIVNDVAWAPSMAPPTR